MKETLIKTLQQKPYFLVLLPFFFIMHGYNEFFSFFSLKFTVLHLVLALVAAAILYLLSVVYLKQVKKAALLSFWALLFILTFGSVHDLLKSFGSSFFSSYKFLLPLSLLLCIVFVIRLKKSTSAFQRTFVFLNLLLISFFIYELVDGIQKFMAYKQQDNLIDNRFTAFNNYKPQALIADSAKPDIYLLVFDGMPSTKAMKTAWNYDNGLLDSFLLKEKFFISEDSKSNYNLTVLSISSTLNMDYTPPVDLKQDETKMYFKASASILNNSLTKVLHKEGYQVSQYQPVSFNNKDWDGQLFFEDMLYMNYFYKTFPGRIYHDLGWHFSKLINNTSKKYEDRNSKAENDLLKTIELVKKSCSSNKKEPQFVYAHFVLPHEPYIFDSTGKRKPALQTIEFKEEDQPMAFMEQVKFANNMIYQLITHIKKTNKPNTVIIVEGDHGYRNIYGKKGYMIFDNLNAIYFPQEDYQLLYPSISPVNSFRVVLNKFFSANLPLLKDSSIFIPYTLPGEK